jgi:hypothetical protein
MSGAVRLVFFSQRSDQRASVANADTKYTGGIAGIGGRDPWRTVGRNYQFQRRPARSLRNRLPS